MDLLVVIDMQYDFIDGSLGTPEAQAILPKVIEKINNWNGPIFATRDCHYNDYLETQEGKKLPIRHCVESTKGYRIHKDVSKAMTDNMLINVIDKETFGSLNLPEKIISFQNACPYNCIDSITVIGLCTDICIVNNIMILKAAFPEVEIYIDSSCCAGTTPKTHEAALTVMRNCQINVI